MRGHVILAVFKRNVESYFSGVLGFLFITVFVLAAMLLTFTPQFYTNNLANLDELNQYFPLLLLFIVPAITMGIWADERRQGTDELLFTLPAKDFEILLGKYLSVLAVYTVALGFLVVFQGRRLEAIADPDWWLLGTTYLGYWLAGAALLSAGMFASSLIANTTAAFVLGVVICAVPVFIGDLPPSLLWSTGLAAMLFAVALFVLLAVGKRMEVAVLTSVVGAAAVTGLLTGAFRLGVRNDWGWLTSVLGPVVTPPDWVEPLSRTLSLSEQFREFGIGLIPLSGLAYFGSLTAFMLYLNLVVISRRHWSADRRAPMGLLHVVCAVSLAITLVAWNYTVGKAGEIQNLRIDATSEGLHSLTEATRGVLEEVPEDRPVTIQAFMSPDVPRNLVNHAKELRNLLRQFDRLGGGRVEVRFVDVEPFSKEAELAKQFGIAAQPLRFQEEGRERREDVYLGAVVSSPLDEVVIPFFDESVSVEYELSRSVGTVTNQQRLTVGVLATDANLMGAPDPRPRPRPEKWRIVEELEKQYEVETVSPDRPIDVHETIAFTLVDGSEEEEESDEATEEDDEKGDEAGDETDADAERPRPLESLEEDPASALDDGELTEELRKKLRAREIRISEEATFETLSGGKRWKVSDTNPERTYTFELEDGTLTIEHFKYDVLIAVLPSSLTQPQMDNLVGYVESGRPTLIFDDPFPGFVGLHLAPVRPKPPSRMPGSMGRPPSMPKADDGKATTLLNALGVDWDHDEIVWDDFNPHPAIREMVSVEMFFISPESGVDDAFNPESSITSGLQEMLMMYPGQVKPLKGKEDRFTPLLFSSADSGTVEWGDIVQRTPFGIQIDPNPRRRVDEYKHRLAARIRVEPDGEDEPGLNAVFVADVDTIADPMFRINSDPELDLHLDNVTFVLNAVDVLAGNEDYVQLRKRRPKHRTLTEIERRAEKYREERRKKAEQARKDADKRVEDAEKRFEKRKKAITGEEGLSGIEKLQRLGMARMDEQQRLEIAKENIERETQEEIEQLRAEEQRQIREIQSRNRFWAVTEATVALLVLGLVVLAVRVTSERSHVDPRRLAEG